MTYMEKVFLKDWKVTTNSFKVMLERPGKIKTKFTRVANFEERKSEIKIWLLHHVTCWYTLLCPDNCIYFVLVPYCGFSHSQRKFLIFTEIWKSLEEYLHKSGQSAPLFCYIYLVSRMNWGGKWLPQLTQFQSRYTVHYISTYLNLHSECFKKSVRVKHSPA